MSRIFNITPKPRMLLGVQNQKWNISGAVAELIDNSFGGGRGNADTVKIIYDATRHSLTVLDDGIGMEYIGRLFQLGNTIGHVAGDIGHFGSGGTQAIIWLAEWVNVATCRLSDNKIMSDQIRWADIFDMEDFRDVAVSDEWKAGNFSQFSEFQNGTAIQIKMLGARKLKIANLVRDLSRLFAPGLRGNKTIIWCQKRNDQIVEEYKLTDQSETKAAAEDTVHFNFTIEYGKGAKKKFLPVAGIVSFKDGLSHADSVVRIGLGYREVMRTRDCYRHETTSYPGIGISGWLDLGDGWQEFLSTTKDGINDTRLYNWLMAHVFKQIEPLLKKSEQQAIHFELDNIALNLQFALEKAMKVKVDVKPGINPGGAGRGNGDGNQANLPGVDRATPKANNELGNEKIAPANSSIHLVPQDDEEMMGVLARAGLGPDGIYVDINTDHIFVAEALRQKPVNAAALNLMIVSEVASLLIDKPALMREAFKKALNDELDNYEGGDKTRKLVRVLIDNVADKNTPVADNSPTAEAAE